MSRELLSARSLRLYSFVKVFRKNWIVAVMAAMVVGFGIGGLPSATAVGVRVSKAAVGVFVVERPRVTLVCFQFRLL